MVSTQTVIHILKWCSIFWCSYPIIVEKEKKGFCVKGLWCEGTMSEVGDESVTKVKKMKNGLKKKKFTNTTKKSILTSFWVCTAPESWFKFTTWACLHSQFLLTACTQECSPLIKLSMVQLLSSWLKCFV